MFRYEPTHSLMRIARITRTARTSRPAALTPRFLSTTPARFAQKDAQDKDSLKPRSTEYGKSGSDDGAAHSNAAFNPSQTSPEDAEATAESEEGGNSLNASPGNPDISKPNDSQAGISGGAPDKKESGGGGAPKAGGSASG